MALSSHELDSSKRQRRAGESGFAAAASLRSSSLEKLQSNLQLELKQIQYNIDVCQQRKHYLLNKLNEKQAAYERDTDLKKITPALVLHFVNGLENANQYFKFKEYLATNDFLKDRPSTVRGTVDLMDTIANKQEIREMFDKLSTEDLMCAMPVLMTCCSSNIMKNNPYTHTWRRPTEKVLLKNNLRRRQI